MNIVYGFCRIQFAKTKESFRYFRNKHQTKKFIDRGGNVSKE